MPWDEFKRSLELDADQSVDFKRKSKLNTTGSKREVQFEDDQVRKT